ncbi:MAG TPA: hypothetical protein VGK01_18450 [Candidatus Angelobacter sp.]|jgi:hypothetical protein
MRTLWLPRIGCWLFYLFTLVGIFIVLMTGLAFVAASTLIKHYFENPAHKNSELAWLGGTSAGLMFVGKSLLSARKKKPFQFVMKRFMKLSFTSRVGDTLPRCAVDDPQRLAFRAVYDDNYPDKDYGPVQGWGVRACCKRLSRIEQAAPVIANPTPNPMSSRLVFLVGVFLALFGVRFLSNALRGGVAHEMVTLFPGAATLGFYAVTATTYIAMIVWHAARHRSIKSLFSRHSLLFLTVAGFCLDYVLNDYREINGQKDGSYGLVVFIDLVIWASLSFVTIRYFPKKGNDYSESSIVWLLPVFPILREIAHGQDLIHFGAATVDLLVGMMFMIAWVLLPYGFQLQSKYNRTATATKYLILAAIVYAILSIVENVLSHFLGLDTQIIRLRKFFGGFWFNSLIFALAAIVAFALFYGNPKNLRPEFAGPCS